MRKARKVEGAQRWEYSYMSGAGMKGSEAAEPSDAPSTDADRRRDECELLPPLPRMLPCPEGLMLLERLAEAGVPGPAEPAPFAEEEEEEEDGVANATPCALCLAEPAAVALLPDTLFPNWHTAGLMA